jgi:LPS-assembly protein
MKGQKSEVRSQKSDQKEIKHKFFLSVFYFLFSVFCLLSSDVWAITITADHLEYFKEEDKYVATGNVRIEKEDAVLRADKVILYQKTSDAEAIGSVIYEDSETLINTERAELNIDAKTGKLYNAVIFVKNGNYWINGDNIQKIKEDHYYASTATFTTCNTEPSKNPDWCFKGSNVDIIVGKQFSAKDVTYRIKGMPILYSPYLWAPVQTDRQTGFLFPVVGATSKKGFQFSPSFFWAIDENKDATFYLDYYSKRGIGKGIEYRYIDFNSKGDWYVYHIRDRELKKNFYEVKGFKEYSFGDIKGFFDINYINHEEFYKEYSPQRDVRIKRFLQSSGELSAPLPNSRLYLLGQHWIDLKDEDSRVPHRLPEIGYFVNPVNIGPLMFTMSSSIANFYREKEPRGQRLDINPTISYSFGNSISFFQSLSLRGTAYKLKNEADFDSSPHRETFQYRANAITRFIRQYESFTHVIEPSFSYTFIPETKELPLFDSTELFDNISIAQFSLYSRLKFDSLILNIRLAQPYDFSAKGSADPLLPTKLEASLSGPLNLSFDMSYDFNKGRTEIINSEISIKVFDDTSIKLGERYSREHKIMFYKAAIDSTLTKKWAVNANIWYDAKGRTLRDSALKIKYDEQCWAAMLAVTRKPGDDTRASEYSFMVFIELKGIGMLKVL